MGNNDYMRQWRANLSPEKKEETNKKNAARAKARYDSSAEVRAQQQINFKKSYNEDSEFRAKIVMAASVGRYGKTPKEYEAQLVEQNGHCALCNSTDGDAGRRLHNDHNHSCCKVGPPKGRTCGECNRGLLCGICNRRLAALEAILRDALVFPMLGKDQSWTGRALRYLIDWEHKHKIQKETHGKTQSER